MVIAIHNEEKYLPYCLASLWDAPVDEFIFVLDRCTDGSEKIVKHFAAHHTNCKILYKTDKRWLQPVGEAFDYGASVATGDYVFMVPADAIIDLRVFDETHLRGKPLMFRYYNYNVFGSKIPYAYEKILFQIYDWLRLPSWQCFMEALPHERRVRGRLPPEDILGFRKVPQLVLKNIIAESEKRFQCIQNTKILHLRPGLSKEEQLLRGVARYVLGYPLWKVLLHSLLFFRIYVLVGYLQAKRGAYGNLEALIETIKRG